MAGVGRSAVGASRRVTRRDVADLYLDGSWRPSASSARLEVVDPATEDAWGASSYAVHHAWRWPPPTARSGPGRGRA